MYLPLRLVKLKDIFLSLEIAIKKFHIQILFFKKYVNMQ